MTASDRCIYVFVFSVCVFVSQFVFSKWVSCESELGGKKGAAVGNIGVLVKEGQSSAVAFFMLAMLQKARQQQRQSGKECKKKKVMERVHLNWRQEEVQSTLMKDKHERNKRKERASG